MGSLAVVPSDGGRVGPGLRLGQALDTATPAPAPATTPAAAPGSPKAAAPPAAAQGPVKSS